MVANGKMQMIKTQNAVYIRCHKSLDYEGTYSSLKISHVHYLSTDVQCHLRHSIILCLSTLLSSDEVSREKTMIASALKCNQDMQIHIEM